ncbi:MAG: endonuclease [Bacteroidetes bacterium]|nr:endonuclease [Bacteroidota bacterium]
MKKTILFLGLLIAFSQLLIAQPTGYYNGCEGKDGAVLKAALHGVIKGHVEYSYTDVWNILQQSDEDPSNPGNIMLIYTGRSQDKYFRDRGTSFDYAAAGYTLSDAWNREHVWAKSHGDFGTEPPAGCDAHNLKPVDRTVNTSRYNKDFAEGGTPNVEATECNSTSSSWEPRDAVKGDVARIIFYMATRYEGENGEPDLEAVDKVNTYPLAEHGKLSDLLKWNEQDPPDDFERNRNNVIYTWQKNRNPFIDHPEFVNLIWGTGISNNILISNIELTPLKPTPEDPIKISANISSDEGTISASIAWGTSYEQVSSTIDMSENESVFSGTIPAQPEGTTIYYKINATNGTDAASSFTYSFKITVPFAGTLTSIYDIQGQTNISPMADRIVVSPNSTQELGYGEVSTSGIVTGVFGTSFYIQSGTGAWNGVYVYDSGYSPSLGDSVIITAIVSEFYELTEMCDLTYYSVVSSNNPLPQATEVTTKALATGNADAEQYEGVLVKVQSASCTEELGKYGLWKVNDGSGECYIHNPTTFSFSPTVANVYDITGIATYNYNESKIDIRTIDDVVESQDIFAPTVRNFLVADGNSIKIDFNEELNTTTAIDTLNYVINNGVKVTNVSIVGFTNTSVKISVTGLTVGDYNLVINGVEDLAGNAMDNVSVDFHSECTGINDINSDMLKVFPNPVNNNILNISSVNNIKKVEISNIAGQIVYRNQYFNEKNIVINLDNITKGLYFTKIYTQDNEAVISKLIIN